jgi:hypothetical protein
VLNRLRTREHDLHGLTGQQVSISAIPPGNG